MNLAGELSLSLSAFCSLANWDLSAANSIAVGGGASAEAAAATGRGAGGRAGGRREERGIRLGCSAGMLGQVEVQTTFLC